MHPIEICTHATKNMYKNVHSSTICINSKLETIQMPIESKMDKEMLVYSRLDTIEQGSANFFLSSAR